MAILIWRIIILIVALVLLAAVIRLVMRSVRSSRTQVDGVRRDEKQREPDISDAEYREADDRSQAEDPHGG